MTTIIIMISWLLRGMIGVRRIVHLKTARARERPRGFESHALRTSRVYADQGRSRALARPALSLFG